MKHPTLHTKEELLTSRFEKGQSVHGPHHDGGPKPGFHSDKPVLLSHPEHMPNVAGQTDHQNPRLAFGGKAPKPKRAFTDQLPLHSNAERQTSGGGAAFGADHSSALDAMSGAFVPAKDGSNPNAFPLTKIAPGKRTMVEAVPPVVGHRSRRLDRLGGGAVGENMSRAPDHSEAVELGRRVYEEALAVAGADHPENQRRRADAIMAQQTIGRRK